MKEKKKTKSSCYWRREKEIERRFNMKVPSSSRLNRVTLNGHVGDR
jgi:hypothetical protein